MCLSFCTFLRVPREECGKRKEAPEIGWRSSWVEAECLFVLDGSPGLQSYDNLCRCSCIQLARLRDLFSALPAEVAGIVSDVSQETGSRSQQREGGSSSGREIERGKYVDANKKDLVFYERQMGCRRTGRELGIYVATPFRTPRFF